LSASLVVRADAGPQIGMGHAMRCLAIAQAWQRSGASCVWATAEPFPGLEARLRDESIDIVHIDARRGSLDDARHVVKLAAAQGGAWTLVDGYRFGAAYQEVLADAGGRAAWMDDCGLPGTFAADLVVNPNAAVRSEWYARRRPRTRVLLGPRYAPLRREFVLRGRPERTLAAVGRRLLISLGGADPDNAAGRVLEAADRVGLDGLEIRVIAGPANAHVAALGAAAKRGVEVIESVTDMATSLEWADVAITGAGGTAWEALYVGVPALLVVVAEDQRGNAVELDRLGVARLLGDGRSLDRERIAAVVRDLVGDPEQRRAMSARGRALVDGRGASRILAAMREDEIVLRRARPDDRELLFRWANDPATRAASFSSASIGWEEHVRWLEAKLADPGCALFVATTGGGEPLGTVRFEGEATSAVISTTIDAAWRSRGYGAALIRAACRAYFASLPADDVHAYVKADNEGSRLAFLAAGFDEDVVCEKAGFPARRLVLNRSESTR
jgi:UDP-2,4-diacetamido-2,4,6-trideoxy-beta-L-altropyranose hydrolase